MALAMAALADMIKVATLGTNYIPMQLPCKNVFAEFLSFYKYILIACSAEISDIIEVVCQEVLVGARFLGGVSLPHLANNMATLRRSKQFHLCWKE